MRTDLAPAGPQGVFLVEVGQPRGWMLVTGEDNIEMAVLVVPLVNQRTVGYSPGRTHIAHLVNNRAGGAAGNLEEISPYRALHKRSRLPRAKLLPCSYFIPLCLVL